MEFDSKEMAKYMTLLAIIIVGALAIYLIRPVFISIVTGFILAYICLPLYRKALSWVKSKNLSAALVLTLIILIIIVPLWFALPVVIKQVGEVYYNIQHMNIGSIVKAVIPTASDETLSKITLSVQNALVTATKSIAGADSPINVFYQLPTILINLFIIGFVFFFGLRDSDKLIELAKEISPFSKTKEKLFVQQFKGVTDSIVYGQIIVGIVQGLLAGLGFLIFGVNNILVLTALAILFSIIPVLGPFIVYIPVAIFMFASGQTSLGLLFLVYNLTVVSTTDNFMRAYIVSKRTKMNSAIVFVGMMAGLFVFGFMGLLIGPLILAFFLLVLQLYKDKALHGLFSREEDSVILPKVS